MVREYIKTHELYDVKDPSVIHCADDPLGRLFGVESFTIHDVLSVIILAFCFNSSVCHFNKIIDRHHLQWHYCI